MNISRAVALGAILAGVFVQSVLAAEPSIDKRKIVFHLVTHYHKAEWTWTPSVRFRLIGPLTSSSVVSIAYTLPGGKPFVSAQCYTYAIPENDAILINDCGFRQEDSVATNQTGVFGFQIRQSDGLAGVNKTLYEGKFTVGKQLYNPNNLPAKNKQFHYYVDNDWRLPIAYVGTVSGKIHSEMWVKRPFNNLSQVRGYLYYNGKQVAEESASVPLSSTPLETKAWEYHMVAFTFRALTEKSPSVDEVSFRAYENPGEYEIKLLRDGKLARTLKFTVGNDGKPTDGGVAKQNGVANEGALVPAMVLGDGDGAWRKDAWKTEAFFANPVVGFTH